MWKLHSDRLKYLGFHTSIIQLKACLAEGSPLYSPLVRRRARLPGASGDAGTKGQFIVTCGRLSGLLIKLQAMVLFDHGQCDSLIVRKTTQSDGDVHLRGLCPNMQHLIRHRSFPKNRFWLDIWRRFVLLLQGPRWKWHNWQSMRKEEKAPFAKRFGTSALYAKALPLLSGCRSDKSYSNSPIYYSFLLQNQCLSAVIAIRGRAHQQNCRS